jgi:hypothetical protein
MATTGERSTARRHIVKPNDPPVSDSRKSDDAVQRGTGNPAVLNETATSEEV